MDNIMSAPFLRSTNDETLLAILNLGDESASGFSLTLDQDPLIYKYHIFMVYGQ